MWRITGEHNAKRERMINQCSMSLKTGASYSIMCMWKPFILRGDQAPGYHCDNKLITNGCTGRRIGVPQRIRVTTWNQAHINYTNCVKSERMGMSAGKAKPLMPQRFQSSPKWL